MADLILTFEWPTGQQEVTRQIIRAPGVAIQDLTMPFNSFVPVIRNRHRKTFAEQRSPITGLPWTPLTDEYAERKAKMLKSAKAQSRRASSAAKRARKPLNVRKLIKDYRKAIKTAAELAQGTISKSFVKDVLRVTKRKVKSTLGQLGNILVLTGAMKRAATVSGAPGNITVISPQTLLWRIDLGKIYPGFHQTTDKFRKDGRPLKRQWLGLKLQGATVADNDLEHFKWLLKAHIRGTLGKVMGFGRP